MSVTLQQHVAEFASVLNKPSVEEEKLFVKRIKRSSKISPQLALSIYKNNIRGSKVNALKVIYPACKNILGDDTFQLIANEFVNSDVIDSPDLNHYGVAFDQHLNLLSKTNRLPAVYNYLPDLARLEFQVHAAYYADDDLAFDFELFENRMQKEQKIFLRVSKSLGLQAFEVSILEVWMKNSSSTGNTEGGNVEAITEIQYLLIHRKKHIPTVVEINVYEYQLLNDIMNNHSLQSIISSSECEIDVMLPKLIAKKWITGVM